MVTTISNEIMNPEHFPTMDFLIRKQFQDYENLKKTILLKEIAFKDSSKNEMRYALESLQLEKELGELYMEFNVFLNALSILK